MILLSLFFPFKWGSALLVSIEIYKTDLAIGKNNCNVSQKNNESIMTIGNIVISLLLDLVLVM